MRTCFKKKLTCSFRDSELSEKLKNAIPFGHTRTHACGRLHIHAYTRNIMLIVQYIQGAKNTGSPAYAGAEMVLIVSHIGLYDNYSVTVVFFFLNYFVKIYNF